MPNAIQSLNQIPFSNLIGGPLTAAVQAQAVAAQTSVDFIEKVAFDPANPGELKNVTFKYNRVDGTTEQNFQLDVPILAIVPIPYLRIDELNIDFTAKLNDMVDTSSSSSSNFNFSGGASAGWGWGRASFRASYSSSHSNQSRSTSSAEYTMNVKVRAVQAEVPGGLAKILDILESVITEKPITASS